MVVTASEGICKAEDDSPAFRYGDEVVYRPQPKQLLLHQAYAPYILFGGARAGGKSYSLLWEGILTCLTADGVNALLLRKTYPQLEKTLLLEMSKIPTWLYKSWHKGKNIVTFHNGSTLIFGSVPNPKKVADYQGGQFILIGIDEASEWTYAEWEALSGANRSPVKVDNYGNPIHPRMIAASNPGGAGHSWLKALFVDKKPAPGMYPGSYHPEDYLFIQSKIIDNKYFADDVEYRRKLEAMNPVLRAMMLDGDWNAIAGGFFSNFAWERTMIPEDDSVQYRASQNWQPKWIAIDWGFTHHFSVVWGTTINLHKPDGRQVEATLVYREYVDRQLGEGALAQEIVRLSNGEKIDAIYLSPDAFGDGPQARAKIMGDVFVTHGLPRPSKAKDQRVDGWRYVYESLADNSDHPLLISDSCVEVPEAIPLVIRDVPSRPEDIVKTGDAKCLDVMDSLRYLCYSRKMAYEKPDSAKLKEIMAPLIAKQDYTSAHMAHLQFQDKQKSKTQPLFTRRRR